MSLQIIQHRMPTAGGHKRKRATRRQVEEGIQAGQVFSVGWVDSSAKPLVEH
jgi:hypothetical protein